MEAQSLCDTGTQPWHPHPPAGHTPTLSSNGKTLSESPSPLPSPCSPHPRQEGALPQFKSHLSPQKLSQRGTAGLLCAPAVMVLLSDRGYTLISHRHSPPPPFTRPRAVSSVLWLKPRLPSSFLPTTQKPQGQAGRASQAWETHSLSLRPELV